MVTTTGMQPPKTTEGRCCSQQRDPTEGADLLEELMKMELTAPLAPLRGGSLKQGGAKYHAHVVGHTTHARSASESRKLVDKAIHMQQPNTATAVSRARPLRQWDGDGDIPP